MPVVFDKLVGQLFLHDHPIKTIGSDPASARNGNLILNTTDHKIKVWYNSSWQTIHTLSAAADALLLENGDYFLLESGDYLLLEG